MAAEFEKPVLVGEPVQRPDGLTLTIEEFPSSGHIEVMCGVVSASYSVDELKLLGYGNRSHGINRIAQTWYKASKETIISSVGAPKILLQEITRLQQGQ